MPRYIVAEIRTIEGADPTTAWESYAATVGADTGTLYVSEPLDMPDGCDTAPDFSADVFHAGYALQPAGLREHDWNGAWRCETCGTQDESDRYDGGDACTRCVHDAFAEGG